MGHNEGSGTTYSWSWRARYLALTESIRAQKLTATLVQIGQNPARANNWQAERIAVYKEIAARQGYGFIDVHAAFIEAGGDLTIDGIHPSPAGARLWADVMLEAFTRTKAEPRTPVPSMLSRRTVENRMPNGALTEWTGAEPAGWTAASATVAKDTTSPESGSAAATITSTATNGGIYINLDTAAVRGRHFTLAVRAKIHAGAVGSAGRIGFYDNVGGSILQATGSEPTDGYRWLRHEGDFDPAATTARVYIFSGDSGSAITVDRIVMVEGIAPTDAAQIAAATPGGSASTPWGTPAGLTPQNGATFNALQVRRQGNTVYRRVDQLVLPASASQMIVAMVPAGYRCNGGPPGAVGNSITHLLGTGNNNQRFLQYMSISGGNLFWSAAWDTQTKTAAPQPARIDGIFMWHTEDPMPA